MTGLALAELAAPSGSVTAIWRQWSPWSRAPQTISLESFEQLVHGPALRLASRAELEALGAPFDDCPAATLIVLSVEPALGQLPDALLIALHASDESLDPGPLTELKACLEHGLSVDRRKRLAEAVFHAVEQAADSIELTDSDARLLYANAAWERTFGHSAREAVGQTVGRLFRDPVDPIHDSAFYQFTLATLADGQAWSGALACRTRDGRRVLCEPMVSPFTAQDQDLTGNFAVRRNLAQRAERDTALAIAHHEFRAVLAAIPDGVAVLRDGKIYFVNTAFLSMLRRTEESVIGLECVELVHADDRDHFLEAHDASVRRVRVVRADASLCFAEISIAGMVSFEGKPAMILLSRDVTEQRVAQEQLARAEKLSALGALAAGVAHEINNPLAYVSLNLRYLRGTNVLHGPALDALIQAIAGAERIQRIVAELRGYSGPDSPGPPEPVEVAKAATSAINIAQNEIRHRAQLERSFEDDLYVLAREGQLVQVLVNLLVNAAQAVAISRGHDHLIRVTAHAVSENSVLLEISDTGTGFDANLLPHVFDPFATTKRRGEGSGLGLAISKRIVAELGGQLSIHSRAGAGSTVSIMLPRASRGRAAVDEGLSVIDGAARAEPRVRLLIVDDEVILAETLERVLSQFEITIACDARAAIDRLTSELGFDAVLCDLMMPGVSGPELYAQACRLRPVMSSRFVFMTGGAFTDEAREFLERSGCPVLSKPFSMDNVSDLVERIAKRNGR